MKPASSAKRAKRAKAAAKSAKNSRFGASKSKKAAKSGGSPKGAGGKPNPKKAAGHQIDGLTANQGGELSLSVEGTIVHARPTLGRQELQAVAQTMRSGAIGPGVEVKEFENEFCRFLGLPQGHAVAVCSGTIALYLALRLACAGDKTVAIPAYADTSVRSAVEFAGAEMIVVDAAADKVHIDAHAAIEAATDTTGSAGGNANLGASEQGEREARAASGKKAEVAVVCHTFGLPAGAALAALKELVLIEDCREALGAKINDRPVGVFGDFAAFSFGATKMITSAGQGGMLVCKDLAQAEQARSLSRLVKDYDGKEHINFTMTDIQAAVGRVQLAKLPNFLARREEIFEQYVEAGFAPVDSEEPGVTAVRYRAVLRVESPQALLEHLASGMIEALVPIQLSALPGDGAHYPRAKGLCISTLSIPIYPHLSNDEVAEIIEQVQLALE